MKDAIGHQISQQDILPDALSLSFNNVRHYRSKTGGILSIIFVIAVFAVIYFKVADVFRMDNISIETIVDRKDFSLIDIYDMNPEIRLRVNSSTSKVYVKSEDQF